MDVLSGLALTAAAAADDDDDDDDGGVDMTVADGTGCGGVVDNANDDDVNVVTCDANDVHNAPADGDLGTASRTAFRDAVELPYNKLTKFKFCADELDDSSGSVVADVDGLIGVFARFA